MRELTFTVTISVPDELCDRGFAEATLDALLFGVDHLGLSVLHFPDQIWPYVATAESNDWENLPEMA